jgi:transcription termination factor NusB
MSLTQTIATEQYQLACDQLMEIAEDYNASEKTSEIALSAAQELTRNFIDNTIDGINDLNRQYDTFIKTMTRMIKDLEQTTLELLLIEPLKQSLQTAKKKRITPIKTETSWHDKFSQLIAWLRERAGIR